jgi:spore germination protein YaaH
MRYLLYILFNLLVLNTVNAQLLKHKHDSSSVHKFFAKLKSFEQKLFIKKHHDSVLKNAFIPIENPNTIVVKKDNSVNTLKNQKIIFGWHPNWNEDSFSDYNFNLLTHIAYFACDVDVLTGKLKNKDAWDNTQLVEYAKSQNPNCKVLLTITCFGEFKTTAFLHNQKQQNALILELYNTIINKKADGICLDFEELATIDQANYVVFIQKLKEQFKKNNLSVFVTVPAVEAANNKPDYKQLNAVVDNYIIMGYDYFGGFSKEFDGPIAPLKKNNTWIPYGVQSSVEYYLNEIPDSLLILGVPYYGGLWEVNSLGVPGKPINFIGHRTYSSALQFITKNKFFNDTLIGASYYSFQTKENTFRHYWMETEYTMGAKYDLVLQKRLKGVAIFALGFDYGSNTFWNLINNKFFGGQPSTNIIKPITNDSLNADTKIIADSTSKDSLHKNESVISITKIISLIKTKPYTSGIILFSGLVSFLIVLLKTLSNKNNIVTLKTNKLFYLFVFATLTVFVLVISIIAIFGFKGYIIWFFVSVFFILLFIYLIVHYIKTNKGPMP